MTELRVDLQPLLKSVERSMGDVADEEFARSQKKGDGGSASGAKEGKKSDLGDEQAPGATKPSDPKLPEGKPADEPAPKKALDPEQKEEPRKSWFLPATTTRLAKTSKAEEKAAYADWQEVEERLRLGWRLSRGDAEAKLDGNVLKVEITFNYGIAVALENAWGGTRVHACGCAREEWCGAFHGARSTAVARWTIPLGLGDNLRMKGEPSFELEAPGECRLPRPDGKSRIDAKKILLESLSSWEGRGSRALVSTVEEFEGVEKVARSFWSALQIPSPPDDEKEGPWFKLRPRALEAGDAQILGNVAHIPVRVAVQPVLSPWPPTKPSGQWPPPSDLGDASGFNVVGRFAIDVATLRQRLESKFLERRFPERRGYQVDPHFVEITGVELYKSEGFVVVAFTLEGTAKGRIAYTGTLQVDSETETLSIRDLELTEASRRSLDMLYDKVERADLRVERVPWIDGEKLGEEIARAAQWPLAQRVGTLKRKAQIASRLAAAPSRQLRFIIEDHQFMTVSMSAEAVEVLLGMSGQAELMPMKAQPPAEEEKQASEGAKVSKTPESAP